MTLPQEASWFKLVSVPDGIQLDGMIMPERDLLAFSSARPRYWRELRSIDVAFLQEFYCYVNKFSGGIIREPFRLPFVTVTRDIRATPESVDVQTGQCVGGAFPLYGFYVPPYQDDFFSGEPAVDHDGTYVWVRRQENEGLPDASREFYNSYALDMIILSGARYNPIALSSAWYVYHALGLVAIPASRFHTFIPRGTNDSPFRSDEIRAYYKNATLYRRLLVEPEGLRLSAFAWQGTTGFSDRGAEYSGVLGDGNTFVQKYRYETSGGGWATGTRKPLRLVRNWENDFPGDIGQSDREDSVGAVFGEVNWRLYALATVWYHDGESDYTSPVHTSARYAVCGIGGGHGGISYGGSMSRGIGGLSDLAEEVLGQSGLWPGNPNEFSKASVTLKPFFILDVPSRIDIGGDVLAERWQWPDVDYKQY